MDDVDLDLDFSDDDYDILDPYETPLAGQDSTDDKARIDPGEPSLRSRNYGL